MEREINEKEIKLQRENIIIGGIPIDQFYTKEETDLLLAGKASTSSVNEINDEISSINQEQATQNTDISQNKTKISNIEGDITAINDQISSIDSEIDNLSLITETGSQIALNISTTDYKMTAVLKDKNGNTIFTSNEIDLPLESVVVDGRYDDTNKKIILELQNGNEIDFSVADLVSGLVSTADLQQELTNYATKDDLNNLSLPVFKYQSSANFELSNKEPGLYVLSDSNYAISLKFNNSTKASQLKLLGNTIKVLKKYEDATNGEVFATYVNLGMVLVNGSWYYDGFYFVKVKKYNDNVLIEQDTKWNFPFARFDQNTTISGKYTFTTLPESSVVPTTNDQLVNKAYVDSQAGGNNTLVITDNGSWQNFNPDTTSNRAIFKELYDNYNSIENYTVYLKVFSPHNTSNIPEIIGVTSIQKDSVNRSLTIRTLGDVSSNNLSPYNYDVTPLYIYSIQILFNSSGEITNVYSGRMDSYKFVANGNVLALNNYTAYTPTGDYNPATKKYVDDAVAGAGGGGLEEITSQTNIWELDEGIYKVAPNINLVYNTRNFKITVGDHGLILFVEKTANNRTPFYAMGRGIISGYPSINHIIMGSAQNDNYGTYELYEANKLALAVTTNADATMYNKLTFNSYLPESSLTPTTNNQLTNKSYVDSAIANAITTTLGGSF